MRKAVQLFVFLILSTSLSAQTWTPAQLAAANTAKDITYLSKQEKEAIQYINLVRLYPKLFLKIVVMKYESTKTTYSKTSSYWKSLVTELNTMEPVPALVFDKTLYDNAKCLTKEQGKTGKIGHKRDKCPDAYYAECISYGMFAGKDILMQWLVDEGVKDLGHRKNCLSRSYKKVGLSMDKHPQHEVCTVADFTNR